MTTENEPAIIRSMVYISAHDAEKILQVAQLGMDALCMDMEDLTPKAYKDQAREIFPDVARELAAMGIRVMARTNGLGEGAEEDLDAIVSPELHCVNIPKIDDAAAVDAYCAALDKAEKAKKLPKGYTLLRPIIETAMGLHNAFEIAAASDRIAYMGGVEGSWSGDLASSLGYLPSRTGVETLYTRSKVLADVRAAGVPHPIGGGNIGSTELEDIRNYFTECRTLGYTGVHCSGTADVVNIANEVFVPSKEQLDLWQMLLPHLEDAIANGETSTWVGPKHYDIVCLPRIRDNLELARRVGLL
jgi:citrate lyase subunit beta/citryl-CoA lyase